MAGRATASSASLSAPTSAGAAVCQRPLTSDALLCPRRKAASLGLRLVGIDRPGYGLSTLEPGRTIAEWAPIAIAVADHLGLDRFLTMGI